MAGVNLFQFDSYKSFLHAKVKAEKENWGLLTRLAKAAGCQRPYLSRVLNGDAQLTAAQAFGLARYWHFGESETEYFLGLLEAEKAGSAAYRDYWKGKNARLKEQQENLSKVVERQVAPSDEKDLAYYSAWHWTAIHILVSIPDFQTERAISERLGLPLPLVADTLQTLESWGAVRREGQRWKFRAREQHISRDSPLAAFHHANWRNRAVINAQLRRPESIHYTVVQSLSRPDYLRVRDLVLELVQKAAEIAGPSKEEKLMCLACDFFEP